MVFGNVGQLEDFGFLGEKILACFEYAKNHDMMAMTPGFHEIDGDRFYVNLCEYTTMTTEERFWEAHRKYLDIHLMISGAEKIDLCFIENMEQKTYEPEGDFLPMDGPAIGQITLNEGDFLVCWPHDGHRTAIKVEEPIKIRKAIFKVLIEEV